jgi:predicted MPP superfamily phosphohydrolase
VVARFWISFVAFHAAMAASCVVVVRSWVRRLAPGAARFSWLAALAADGLLLAAPAVVLAAVAALYNADPFVAVRLLAQALFGELIALCAWLAGLFWRRGRFPAAAGGAVGCLALVLVYADAYHREPTDLHVRHFSLDLTHGVAARGRLRILQLSDIQANRVGRYEERALRTAAQQKADLVVLTGDYVQPRLSEDRRVATADLNRLLESVRFDARLGVYAVRGDVDKDWPKVFDGTGIRTLAGAIATLPLEGGRTLSIVGLTTSMSHGRDAANLLALVRRSPADSLRLVVGHGPDFVEQLAGVVPVDLALAGHTHGGQVVLPWLGALYIKSRLPLRYASGLHDYFGLPLHVSAGIGMERGAAPQLRFLCPPELSVIEVTY